jgi:hypothetical protein
MENRCLGLEDLKWTLGGALAVSEKVFPPNLKKNVFAMAGDRDLKVGVSLVCTSVVRTLACSV